jgi:hypothetical protein
VPGALVRGCFWGPRITSGHSPRRYPGARATYPDATHSELRAKSTKWPNGQMAHWPHPSQTSAALKHTQDEMLGHRPACLDPIPSAFGPTMETKQMCDPDVGPA